MMLRIVRALNKRRSARYTFFSALQCLSYDYYLYICSYTNFCILSCAMLPIQDSQVAKGARKNIHPTLLATSLLEDLEDLREWQLLIEKRHLSESLGKGVQSQSKWPPKASLLPRKMHWKILILHYKMRTISTLLMKASGFLDIVCIWNVVYYINSHMTYKQDQ